MLPTFENGKIVIIKKFNLQLKHNDIIVIKKGNNVIIKRLVGMPGDTILIKEFLYRNGQKNNDISIENPGQACNEIKLQQNEYFVLGDNINNSIDSRFDEIGIIQKQEIIGKVLKWRKK